MPMVSVQAATASLTPVAQASAASLLASLQALPHAQLNDNRDALVAHLAAWREEHVLAARSAFLETGGVEILLSTLSDVMDAIVLALFRLLTPASLGVVVVATGGYGRREMFPYSDVDFLFLYRPAARTTAERLARTMLYVLWDLGLKVGHALRGVDDTLQLANDDLTIRTNLLDSRPVAGDEELFAQFADRFEAEIVTKTAEEFVEKKLAERDDRHQRFGDSRFLLEPNLKESKGGLRDLHTLSWIVRYVYGTSNIGALVALGYLNAEEHLAYQKAKHYLWQMRANLHFLAGKPEERLTFDRQQALAPLMGYRGREGTRAVERLMKHYFLTASQVGNVTRIICALLEDQQRRKPRLPIAVRLNNFWKLEGFTLDGERLQVKNDEDFSRDPVKMVRLFAVAQKHGLYIHPHTLQLVTRNLRLLTPKVRQDAKANAFLLEILLSPRGPEQTLRRMHEVGLLGRLIPDFRKLTGLMQFNLYHIYTVDEHILVALGNLFALEQGRLTEEMPLASEVIKRIQSRRVLYVSLLCHDIAKGRGGDHSQLGADIALKLARQLGLTEGEAEMCAWLVRHHLLFTDAAFKRDASDPQTIRDFIDQIQSVERLRLLLCLTVSDMRAVGPGIWNAWKATLLRGLYLKAERALITGKVNESPETDVKGLRAALLSEKKDAAEVDNYLMLSPPEYLAALDAGGHVRAIQLMERIRKEDIPVAVHADPQDSRAITTLTVVAQDRPGLFSQLAGAMALSSINIVSARIFTLKNGFAADVFQVQDNTGKAVSEKERVARLSLRMRQALNGELDIGRELARQKQPYALRSDAFEVRAQVFIENEVSNTHSVVEVSGRDRVGFLYAVTHALTAQGLTIGSAHISTYGVQAVDVFYVKDGFGMKVMHDKKVAQLKEALLEAVKD